MKSKLSFALGVALLSTTALASSPCGFYGGAGVGISTTDVNSRIFTNNGADSGSENLTKKKTTVIGRFFVGRQQPVWRDCFFSGEVFVAPKEYAQKTVGIDIVDPVTGNATNQNVRLTVERSFTFGAEAKFGRYFDEKTAAYVSLNINGSNVKISYGEFGANTGSDKKFVFGIAPGVGVLHHCTPKDVVKFGYQYETQTKWTTKDLDPSTTDSFNVRSRNRAHAFVLSYSRFF